MAAEQKQRLSPSKLNGKRADDSKSGLPFGPARRLLPHQLEAEICTFLPIADIGSLHRVSHGVSEAVDRVLSNAKALILRNELGDLHPRHRQNWVGISLAAKSCQSLRVLSAPGPISQTVETLLGLLIKRNENTLRELCLDAPASIPGVLECTFPALETFACARAVAFQHVFTRKRMPNLKRLHAGLNNFNIEDWADLLSLETWTTDPARDPPRAIALLTAPSLLNLQRLHVTLEFAPNHTFINKAAPAFASMHALTDLSLVLPLFALHEKPTGEIVPWVFPALRRFNIEISKPGHIGGFYVCPKLVSDTANYARVAFTAGNAIRCELIRDLLVSCTNLRTIEIAEAPSSNPQHPITCEFLDCLRANSWPFLAALNDYHHGVYTASTDALLALTQSPRIGLVSLQCYAYVTTSEQDVERFLQAHPRCSRLLVAKADESKLQHADDAVIEDAISPLAKPKVYTTPKSVRPITQYDSLTELELSQLDFRFAQHRFDNLTSLSLSRYVCTSETITSILQACPALVRLTLKSVVLGAWKPAQPLPSLTYLSLGLTELSANAIALHALVKAFPKLRTLSLAGPFPNEFFAVWVSYFNSSPALHFLTDFNLQHMRIPDTSLPSVRTWQLWTQAVPSLQRLFLPVHEVNTAYLQAVRMACPSLVVNEDVFVESSAVCKTKPSLAERYPDPKSSAIGNLNRRFQLCGW